MRPRATVVLLGIVQLAVSAPAGAQRSHAEEVKAVITRFTAELKKLDEEAHASLAPARAAHVKELERQRDSAKVK